MDLARAKGEASVSIIMIKAIKFKLITCLLAKKKKDMEPSASVHL